MENDNQAIYNITRDVARQQREIEALKYKVAILERDKYEGTSMTYSTEKDIAWAETKAEYAQPNSMIDSGEMYHWANYWHEQYLESCKVREMTVEEFVAWVFATDDVEITNYNLTRDLAKALAALGTIRIMGDV